MQFGPSFDSSPATASTTLPQWRSAIERGNRAFNTGDFASAIDCYRRACEMATQFFGERPH